MLLALGVDSRNVYEHDFEVHFLRVSAEYFRSLAQKFLLENNAITYLRKVEQCIEDESTRTKFYLDSETEKKILKVISLFQKDL